MSTQTVRPALPQNTHISAHSVSDFAYLPKNANLVDPENPNIRYDVSQLQNGQLGIYTDSLKSSFLALALFAGQGHKLTILDSGWSLDKKADQRAAITVSQKVIMVACPSSGTFVKSHTSHLAACCGLCG